jgi:hypothetical protein
MGLKRSSSLTDVKKANKTTKMYHVVKKVKSIDSVYDNISNPLYFYQLTNEHLPSVIPHRFIINTTLYHLLGGHTSMIYDSYDKLSTSKELCEGTVNILRKGNKKNTCMKSKVFLCIKTYIVIYKLIWIVLEMHGVSKDHLTVVAIMDYINFFLAHF